MGHISQISALFSPRLNHPVLQWSEDNFNPVSTPQVYQTL